MSSTKFSFLKQSTKTVPVSNLAPDAPESPCPSSSYTPPFSHVPFTVYKSCSHCLNSLHLQQNVTIESFNSTIGWVFLCSCGLAGNIIEINSLSAILKSISISVLEGVGGKEFSFEEASILVSCCHVSSSYAEICPVRCDAVYPRPNLRPFLSKLPPPFSKC